MENTQQTVRSHRNNRYSAMTWFLQVAIPSFICLGLASEGVACHLPIKPTSLTYYAVQGATNPPNQTITVSRNSTRKATLTASDNRSWLVVSPTSTTMTASKQLTAAINTSGRGAGTYNGTITIKVGTWCTYRAPVRLVIAPPSTSPPSTSPPSTSSATLTWNAVTGATVSGYKVYVGEIPGQYTRTINVGNITSSTVSSLTVGRMYYFVVTAYNSAGESPPSSMVSKTIQ